MVFQVSTSVNKISDALGAVKQQLGVINLTAVTAASIVKGQVITITFRSNVIEMHPVVTAHGATAGFLSANQPSPDVSPFPNMAIAIVVAPNNDSLTLTCTGTQDFAIGDRLWISGIQITPGTLTGSYETGFKAIFSCPFVAKEEPITFVPAIAPVARFS